MSSLYSMLFHVERFNPDKVTDITAAIDGEWGSDENESYLEEAIIDSRWPARLCVTGDGSLCGGESEEEFADRAAAAVWAANGEYCDIHVYATPLENLPYEIHSREREDFDRWQEQQKGKIDAI
jgi:hypothetical protein